jgi:hypothetical protein
MHAYAYAMQMQCTYGAKHLRCYIECVGGDRVAVRLVDGELSPVNGEPASGLADRWGRLTRGPRLSVPLRGVGVKQQGVPNVLVRCFEKGIQEMFFRNV